MTGRHSGISESTPEVRRDPVSGRIVIIAPARGRRPGAKRGELESPTEAELDECPFCEGREDRTPPETFAIGPPEREPDTPGWSVRVVPNLYPAFERQEVVVHTPRHARTLAELSEKELEPIASAWRARIDVARADGFPYVQAILNEGREAGASLPHSHSQLVWLREPPPAAAAEYPQLERSDCAVCSLVEERANLRVAGRTGVELLAAPAGRVPYELLIAPAEHRPDADDALLFSALALLREAILRLRERQGPTPLNVWVHPGGHWHVEVFPRLTVLAGLELGAGLYVNWLPPEEAAAELRAAGV
jgi:UDPglucose--hexose-1-phosphate uridylyltransferase